MSMRTFIRTFLHDMMCTLSLTDVTDVIDVCGPDHFEIALAYLGTNGKPEDIFTCMTLHMLHLDRRSHVAERVDWIRIGMGKSGLMDNLFICSLCVVAQA